VSDPSPHERALAAFELDDVFIAELRCRVAHDFNQNQPFASIRYLHRFEPRNEGIVQRRKTADGSVEQFIFRYLVQAGVRLIKPGVPADRKEFTDEDVLAEIEGLVAVDYSSSRDIQGDLEAISAFGPNVLFHAWPYWRAAVTAIASDMRLPRIVLPMLRQAKKTLIRLDHAESGPE
jgi:hypothetical protein